MNKANCTKGPVTVKPFLTPDRDDDPMMVYKIEGGDLQGRFDSVDLEDEAEVAAIHAENNANAELTAQAFNVLHETGMTPRELAKAASDYRGLLSTIAGNTTTEEAEDGQDLENDEAMDSLIDTSRTLLSKYQPVTPTKAMDNRKLYFRKGSEPHEQAQVSDEATGATVAITYSDTGGAFAAELVKRWNEYPDLLAALKHVHETNAVNINWQMVADTIKAAESK